MARKGRVDIKRILADPDLRRKLMVSTIQATQAREGIEITREEADRAYYVITEGERATFFNLKPFENRKSVTDDRHLVFSEAITEKPSFEVRVRYDIARRDFSAVEGSPLMYSQVSILAHVFKENPRLEPRWADVRGGMNSTDSPRFVRFWWETSSSSLRTWVRYSKGGIYARFYSDLELVFDWTRDGEEFRKLVKERYGSESRFVKSPEFYFKRGLTWTEKSSLGLSVRILEEGAIFNVAGPAAFLKDLGDESYVLGVLNSDLVAYIARAQSGRNYGASYIASLPVVESTSRSRENIESLAVSTYSLKASWDSGNEISTHFKIPWLLREDIINPSIRISQRLDQLTAFEASEDARIREFFRDLNDQCYRLYGIPDATRKIIETNLGERPPEIIWQQMEGKNVEQRRMEHVWRLLSYVVKRIVEEDEDGIVTFDPVSGQPALMEKVYRELEVLVTKHSISQVEVEIVNELKRKVKGYRSVNSIREWLGEVYFQYHVSLYKNRPIFWHIASRQGKSPAFSALVHYHRFDKNAMAKLRGTYLREAIGGFRRESALASKEGREGDRVEWQSRLEEATELDRKLQMVQEGHHEGTEGGDRDYRILTPWKRAKDRPKGWDPDTDDGVKVNIEPLQKAGVLRIAKVI